MDKRRKVGDREALIDQLWSAIEGLQRVPQGQKPFATERGGVQFFFRGDDDLARKIEGINELSRTRYRAPFG